MALDFDGVSQYVSIPGSSSLDCSSAMTVTFWCYGESDAQRHIINKDNGSSNRLWIIRPESSTSLNCHIWTSTGTLINGEVANSFAPNAWHFYTMRAYVSGGNVYVETWMDGVYKGENHAAGTALKTATAQAIQFCRNIYTGEYKYYSGILSDVRVYNRSLSANEIAEIYHKRGADKVWQGLVGRWRLDELPGGTAAPVLLDSMDSTSGWSTDSTGVVSLNSTTYVQGSGALNLTKNQTTKAEAYMFKDISSVNVTGQNIKISAYIKDQTTLDKLTRIQLYLHSALAVNHYYYSFTNLSVGWNELSAHIDDFGESGTPDKTDIQRIRTDADTNNTTDTWAEGDVIFDFYRAGDYVPNSIIDLSGNGNHGTPYNSPVYQASPHRLRRGVLVS